jgi:hypothetical protein
MAVHSHAVQIIMHTNPKATTPVLDNHGKNTRQLNAAPKHDVSAIHPPLSDMHASKCATHENCSTGANATGQKDKLLQQRF